MRVWAASLLCALGASSAHAGPTAMVGELSAFLETIADGAELAPRQYAAQLGEIHSRSGKRSVVPTLSVSAGRLDADSCLYQLRVDLQWTTGGADGDPELGGRSLIQKAPCATLSEEVVAVALYEVSALRRRLQDGGRFATNQERDQVIAAARRAAPADVAQQPLTAITIASRVNLRASPSTTAPVLAKLAPGSVVEVTQATVDGWYQLRHQPGFVHASALQSVRAATTEAATTEAATDRATPAVDAGTDVFVAEVGSAHLRVRDQPSVRGKVVDRLKPGTQLRLTRATESGWFALVERPGFVSEAGLRRIIKAAYHGLQQRETQISAAP